MAYINLMVLKLSLDSLYVGVTWFHGQGKLSSCRNDSPVDCHRQKKPPTFVGGLCWRYLFSRPVTRQLSSAQMSLTSVFGMGTGGPSSQSTPTRMDELSLIFYFAALRGFLLFAALQPLDCIKSFPICQPIFRFLLPNQSPASRV